MLHKTLISALLLTIAGLLGGCGGGTAPADPCVTDPNLAGCVGAISSSASSLTKDNAAAVLSSTLLDLISITEVTLATAINSNSYKTEILTAPIFQNLNLPPSWYQRNDPDGPYMVYIPCDNYTTETPYEYSIIIQILENPATTGDPKHMEGPTMTINFGGDSYESNIRAGNYCQLDDMKISGFLHLTRIAFAEDTPQPGSSTLSGEIWPTIIFHNDTTLTTVANNLALNAIFTPNTGLTVTGTVMDNPYIVPGLLDNINGMVFTHFAAGSDPNASTSTYAILRTGFVITTQMDTVVDLDPLSATQLSVSATGTMLSDRTGTDINMQVATTDAGLISQPLTWSGNVNVIDAPKIAPPGSGALLIKDISTNNTIASTISTTPGNVDAVITDNAILPGDLGHITNLTFYWANLMTPH
jgi:hypothetical protein